MLVNSLLSVLPALPLSDNSDEDPSTCHNYNCSATNRVQCPSGDYCMADFCKVCNAQNITTCPDGSDQLSSSCQFKSLSNCTEAL